MPRDTEEAVTDPPSTPPTISEEKTFGSVSNDTGCMAGVLWQVGQYMVRQAVYEQAE